MTRFDNRSILYLHGYDSSSKGLKPQRLRELCTANRLLIPDLSTDPLQCMTLSEDTLKTASNDTIIIGASLGGFYAYYLAAKYKKDCLLINPVAEPAIEAKKMLALETDLEKKKVILHAANMYLSYVSNLKSLKKPKNCFVALGLQDTVIDPQITREYFQDAEIKEYDDDHIMINSFNEVLSDFEDYLQDKA